MRISRPFLGESVGEFVRLTAMRKRHANKQACPCGSGRRLGRCHHRRINTLREQLGRRWFWRGLKRDIPGLAGIYPAYDFCSPTTHRAGITARRVRSGLPPPPPRPAGARTPGSLCGGPKCFRGFQAISAVTGAAPGR